MTDESMHKGRSVTDCTISIVCRSSGGSVSLGLTAVTPALTSRTWAPAFDLGEGVGLMTISKLPACISAASFLRPVGLMRSPITQKGRSKPMMNCACGGGDEGLGHVVLESVRFIASAIGDQRLEPFLVIGCFDIGLGLVGFGREIIADRDRIGAPPVGEIGIGIGGAAAHGRHVDRLLEAVGQACAFPPCARP